MKNFTVNLISNLKTTLCFNTDIPKPHVFVSLPLKSTIELTEITIKVSELLPQLSGFINQFNEVVITTNVNVVTDAVGNMSLDVPVTMSELEVERITKRIGILDRLITTRGQEINELLQKGINIETKLKAENPKYTSQILDQINEFKRLNASYNH
ncbi:MAG: hypothetical protein KIT57_24710 [Blastocatellales bacterium]|nr:hypothetical protein [Blastocatellales bacterium]